MTSLLDKDTKFNPDDDFQIQLMTEYNFNHSYSNLAEAVANNDIEVATYLMDNCVQDCETYQSKSATDHAIQNRNEKMIDLLNNHGLLELENIHEIKTWN